MKKFCGKLAAVLICCMMSFCLVGGTAAFAKTTVKKSVIASMKGSTITYRKSAFSTDIIPNAEWENIVGYGKAKKVKVTNKTVYYTLTDDCTKSEKVSKKEFKEKLKIYTAKKYKENGVTYYTGMAVKLTIKNGKCTKVAQVYQA